MWIQRGREFEGRVAIARFPEDSMAGLGTWTFPYEWVMVEGDRVVSQWWVRLPGSRPNGQPLQAPGISILRYAGEWLFDYELDILNFVELAELIKMSDWKPNDAMRAPPIQVDRDPRAPER